uniref:Uncharacterized protein n=1 Tax=Calidris pygmaea TaxID=425635 RepID=A0A8C3JI02_9CHAR
RRRALWGRRRALWGRGRALWGSLSLLPPPGCSGRCLLTPPSSHCSAMVSVTMATSEWIQFFRDAGIPPGPAVNYAVTFVDNRIQKTMLLDLTKELMKELGITVVGDVIAILKHAKVVYRQVRAPPP